MGDKYKDLRGKSKGKIIGGVFGGIGGLIMGLLGLIFSSGSTFDLLFGILCCFGGIAG